jgi:hypothetical protein
VPGNADQRRAGQLPYASGLAQKKRQDSGKTAGDQFAHQFDEIEGARAALANLGREVHESPELLTATGKAARNIVAKIDHEDPNISMKASTETLDRAGITKPNEKRTDATINNFGQLLIQQKDKYED